MGVEGGHSECVAVEQSSWAFPPPARHVASLVSPGTFPGNLVLPFFISVFRPLFFCTVYKIDWVMKGLDNQGVKVLIKSFFLKAGVSSSEYVLSTGKANCPSMVLP